MTAAVLVIAIGNESRGDDALGPLLLRRLREVERSENIELLEDFQLQVEHALDLQQRELVLFVDAGCATPAPYAFHRIQASGERALFSHALAPQAVLATYLQLYRQEPPPSFVLCLRGERFELGSGLSPAAAAHLDMAAAFAQRLLEVPTPAAWQAHAAPC